MLCLPCVYVLPGFAQAGHSIGLVVQALYDMTLHKLQQKLFQLVYSQRATRRSVNEALLST